MGLLKRLGKGMAILSLATIPLFTNAQTSNLHDSNLSINKIYLTSCVNGNVCSNKSKDVLLEDKIKLNLVVERIRDGEKVYFSSSPNVEINGKKIEALSIKNLDTSKYNINWLKVEPEGENYNNWVGDEFRFDTPEYKETITDKGKNWTISADAHPTSQLSNNKEGVGTMRYKVEFLDSDKKFSTRGKESKNKEGLKKDVHRISFREDNSFLGWLTSYFNVPYVYGNSKEQADNYLGVDCADLMVAAYRKKGENFSYTSAARLQNIFSKIADWKDISLVEENFYYKGNLIRYGKDVKNEDLILFESFKPWHVGALIEDKSNPKGPFKGKADGILNTYDLMIHTLGSSPEKTTIDYGDFSILRSKDNKK